MMFITTVHKDNTFAMPFIGIARGDLRYFWQAGLMGCDPIGIAVVTYDSKC